MIKDERRRYKKEIGGVAIGDKEDDKVYFYDIIECPNVSTCPMFSYSPSPSCSSCFLMNEVKKNVFTLFHTHTQDTWFSKNDVNALRQLKIEVPAFLSTYGSIGYFLAYSLNPFILETKFFSLSSKVKDDIYYIMQRR